MSMHSTYPSARPWMAALIATAAVLALATCDDPVVPDDDPFEDLPEVTFDDGTLLGVFQGDSLALRLYEGSTGRLLDEIVVGSEAESGQEAFRFISGVEVDRTRGEAVFTARSSRGTPPRSLFSADLSRTEIRWGEPLHEIEARSGGEIGLATTDVPLSGGRRWIFLKGHRTLEGEAEVDRGVAVLGRRSRSIEAYLGGFRSTPPRMVRIGSPGAEDGLLVVGGPRGPEAIRLLVYDAGTLAVRDSVPVAEGDVDAVRLRRMISAGDGRHVFAVTHDSIFRVDAREGAVAARARIAHPYTRGTVPPPVVAGRDPHRFYLADPGGADFPGAGQLQVYDGRTLADLGTVDLRSDDVPTLNGAPVARGVAVDDAGGRLYVAAGTGKFWFGFTAENTLSVVDVHAGALVETHDLDAWDVQDLLHIGR